jgi:hypothetical protein
MKIHIFCYDGQIPAYLRVASEYPEGMMMEELQVVEHRGTHVIAIGSGTMWKPDIEFEVSL